MSFLRLKNGKIVDCEEIKLDEYLQLLSFATKESNTVRGLITKDDLVFYKDGYSGVNAKEVPSISIGDIEKTTQYFEKNITKFYIKLSNGDYRLAAEQVRGELEAV